MDEEKEIIDDEIDDEIEDRTVTIDKIIYRIDEKNYAHVYKADKDIEKAIILPKVDGCVVVGIDPNAFEERTKLWYLEIQLDEAITEPLADYEIFNSYEIGEYAFYGCSALEVVEMPSDGITTIWQGAFNGCSSLVDIELPEGVFVGSYAFCRCENLRSIGTSLGMIMEGTFSGCTKLNDFPVDYGTSEIGEDAFYHCVSLKDIVIPSSVRVIEPQAFRGCHLGTVTFEDPNGWTGRGTYIMRSGELDLSNPRRNARMLGGMDVDGGFTMRKK
ncbi:MAG: leucine-rich repeat domain-containing protein [Clostridia bacterium]|nr:leucine-rich repeat domain-containing protein [Clostridia bacterium]